MQKVSECPSGSKNMFSGSNLENGAVEGIPRLLRFARIRRPAPPHTVGLGRGLLDPPLEALAYDHALRVRNPFDR